MQLLVYVTLVNLTAFLNVSKAPNPAEASPSAEGRIVAMNSGASAEPELPAQDSLVRTQTYESPDLDSDMITLDADGDLLVAGSAIVVGENLDVRVSKYDREGAVIWTKSFTDSPDGGADAFTVALDPEGNVLGIAYEEEDYW